METNEQQNIDNAVAKREKEILSGKYCVKLVSQGKEMGRKEAIKEVLEIIDNFGSETSLNVDEIEELKQQIQKSGEK